MKTTFANKILLWIQNINTTYHSWWHRIIEIYLYLSENYIETKAALVNMNYFRTPNNTYRCFPAFLRDIAILINDLLLEYE